jgi:hypothetical protein
MCVATVGKRGWRVSLIGGLGEGDVSSGREICITTVCHTPVGLSSQGGLTFVEFLMSCMELLFLQRTLCSLVSFP